MAIPTTYLIAPAELETASEGRYLNGCLRNAKMGTTELESHANTSWLAQMALE